MPFWKYEQTVTREDVLTALPDHCTVTVYKVTSGDTGKIYYVQVLKIRWDFPNKQNASQTVYLCNCPEGTFRAPLEVVGAGRGCKHAENLAVFLKERNERRK